MIYLIYGTAKVLINKKIAEIKNSNKDVDANSVVNYNMKEVGIGTAINDLLTVSMFGDKKMVVCSDCYFLTGSTFKTDFEHNIDLLSKYVEQPNDNILILTVNHEKLDVRKKIVKLLNKTVEVINVGDGKKNTEKYIMNNFNDRGYEIDKIAAGYLKEKVGGDISFLENEFDKICLYKGEDKVITPADIDLLVPRSLEDNIFDLMDSIIKNNKKRIFEIYNDLLLKKEEPIKIIVMVANQFRLIYQTKILMKKGYTEKDIASLYGIHPYRVKLAGINSHKYSDDLLKGYLLKLSELDIKIKTGQIDKNIGLELFFIKM
jgi:DNA polymerase-3 subunit delta